MDFLEAMVSQGVAAWDASAGCMGVFRISLSLRERAGVRVKGSARADG